jgi:16S rRNA (uracil1498-N3)-methyltransferase
MHRFFLDPSNVLGNTVTFPAAIARQIFRVLHLKAGDLCLVLDNQGFEHTVKLSVINSTEVKGEVIETHSAIEPAVMVEMLLSLTQREKFEWMLQKCTEIGVSSFQPVISRRSLVQSKVDVLAKYDRWNTILKEAAEQSGRGKIPSLLPPLTLVEACRLAAGDASLCLALWENETNTSLKQVLRSGNHSRVALLIGPEGGFAVEEIHMAEEIGFQPVTLGKRILRMETAAMVSAALILYELEPLTSSRAGRDFSVPVS